MNNFTNKQNLELLWDVLLDELHVNVSDKKLIGNIKTIFQSNISPFTTRANPKLNIMELNKQFLSQVVLAVHRLFPNLTSLQKQGQPIKRLTIFHDDEIFEPYKIEDIHASRQSDFEQEVERNRIDMENFMTPQKPKELDFSDNNIDGKIVAMDSLVAEKMAQRNLEIEQIQQINYNAPNIDPEKWLSSKETSVKNEKRLIQNNSITTNNDTSRFKHMSIDSNNNVILSINETEPKNKNLKKVSWDSSTTGEEPTTNIFNKLKKQSNVELEPDKQYVEQHSVPLPNVKQEEIIIGNMLTQNISNNDPILPKSEIIKQLNEMNKKIDNLYDMIFKLTKYIETNNHEHSKNNKEEDMNLCVE